MGITVGPLRTLPIEAELGNVMDTNLASETAKILFMAAQELGIDVGVLLKKIEEIASSNLSPEEVPAVLAAIKKGSEEERRFR